MKLHVAGLGKERGGRHVLADVHLEVGDGEILALVGPNGAGKSTLLAIVAGTLPAGEGDVRLDGASLLDSHALRRHVGFVPEGADPLAHLAVGELLALTASLRRAVPPPAALLERLLVTPLLGQRLGASSLGQRRRACIAAALVGDPWLLVLDEPTNGLSPDGIDTLVELLRERAAMQKACLLATHDLAFAQRLGARVVAMR